MQTLFKNLFTGEFIIRIAIILKISPHPSLPKRGYIPPFGKGRLGGI